MTITTTTTGDDIMTTPRLTVRNTCAGTHKNGEENRLEITIMRKPFCQPKEPSRLKREKMSKAQADKKRKLEMDRKEREKERKRKRKREREREGEKERDI